MHTPKNLRRPPHEYASVLLEVSKGCTYNRCLFCNLYRDADFSPVPWEHVVEDLDEIAATERNPHRVLLIGGNPFGLSQSKLVPLLQLIREKLPTVHAVGGYMRTADIKKKTDAELAELAALGVTDVALGTECAWDPALKRMNKGHTAADILEQYPRLEAAGIGYSLFYLGGFAGAGRCEESAQASAQVFSQLHPIRITIMTMTPYPGSRLREEVEVGTFKLASESEVMLDVATFIDNLHCETLIAGSHDSNFFRIDGILPRDREGMVATLNLRRKQTDNAASNAATRAFRMKMLAM